MTVTSLLSPLQSLSTESSSTLPPSAAVAAAAAAPPPLCKHWARRKACLYHDKGLCKFDHPALLDLQEDDAETKEEQEKDGNDSTTRKHKHKQRQNQQKQQQQNRHRSKGGRLQVRNDTRVAKFRSFIVQTLPGGLQSLSKHHVLDVAGGKGELAFHLLHLCHVASCYVIDPRPTLELTRFQKRYQRGFYHRSAIALHSNSMILSTKPQTTTKHNNDTNTTMNDTNHHLTNNINNSNDDQNNKKNINDQNNNSNNITTSIVIQPHQEQVERHVGHLRCFFTEELWQAPKAAAAGKEEDVEVETTSVLNKRQPNEDVDDTKENDDDVASASPSSSADNTTAEDVFRANCIATVAWTWPPKGKKNEHNQHEDEEDDDEEEKVGEEEKEDCSSYCKSDTIREEKQQQQQQQQGMNNNKEDDSHDEKHIPSTKVSTTTSTNTSPTTTSTTTPIPTLKEASTITKQCTLIVGMHPDQAVDAIIDAAIQLQISFFVVPCCTYSQEFPNRKHPITGKRVTKYHDLLDYLQAKSNTIQRTTLPFEGKNICLYQIV